MTAPPGVYAFVRRWWGELLTLIVVFPIVAAVARAVRGGWLPIGDAGLLAVRARDVATEHHPLLGSWTSASLGAGVDLNNPGALYDDLLAPLARLIPSYVGIAIAVAALNVAAVTGASLAARTIGGRRLQCVVLAAASMLIWTMGSELLIDIWQPHALLLPFLALIVLALGLSAGEIRWMPWAVGLTSLVIQTHVAYVYAVAALVLAVAILNGRRVGRSRRSWRRLFTSRTALASWTVGAVAWAQPLYEQWFGEGNLGRLVRAATTGRRGLGIELSMRVVAAVFAQAPWRLRPDFTTAISRDQRLANGRVEIAGLPGLAPSVVLLVALVGVLAMLAIARSRHGSTVAANACWLGLAMILVAVWGTASLDVSVTGLGSHQVRWMWTALVFTMATLAWAMVGEMLHWLADQSARRRWLDRPSKLATPAGTLIGIAAIGAFALAAVPFYAQPAGPTADRWALRSLHGAIDDLAVFRPGTPVVYDASTLRPYEPYSGTLMLALQRLGIEFRVVDETWARQLGDSRLADGTERVRVFQLQDGEAMAYDGPACPIAIGSSGDTPSLDELPAILGLVHAFSAGLIEGSILVDHDQIPEDERWVFEGVAGGDVAMASFLVTSGALARLADGGAIELSAAQREQLDLVEGRLSETVLLFAEGPGVCRDEG